MSLGTYNNNYKHKVTIDDIEYKFRPWNTKDEKDYLIAISDNDLVSEDDIFDILVKPCLEQQDVELSKDAQKLLIIEIRKKSIGSTFPMKFSCTSCNRVNDMDVELDNIIDYKKPSFKDVKIESDDEILVFSFTNRVSKSLNSRLNNELLKPEYNFIEFLIHIKSITINDEIHDSFNYEEIEAYIESLPTYIFDELYSQFTSMKGYLNFVLNTPCQFCNKENKVEFKSIPSFLWA